ncbi:hypothetical protein [Geopsychrobacter electrodiphilus]|uniref:hypothetical protein n=1 Tax=Geopsychrobacter electrodiphilus TaxID=225196 RepID=UPI00036B7D8B|nr:hypothetical protein [Geopsychrobacter electrodiphilus]
MARAPKDIGPSIGVVFYITANRRSHYVALIGHWPARAGFASTCRSGIHLFSRRVTAEELKEDQASPRHVAIVFSSFHAMVRYILETSGNDAREGLRKKISDDAFRAGYSLTAKQFGRNLARWQKKKAKELAVKALNRELSNPQMKLAI